MKIKLILCAVFFFFIANTSFAQENKVKYQEIDGRHYKFIYNQNDKLQSKEFVRKETDGSYTSLDLYEVFNNNGDLIFKGNKINGRHIEYYTSGEKKIHGAVVNAEKQGRWTYYNKNNDILKVEIYKAGELLETIDY